MEKFESKEIKRKQRDGNKSPSKRKRMENLIDWGGVEEVGEKPENAEISKWLVSK